MDKETLRLLCIAQPPLVTFAEAAKRIGVSRQALAQWEQTGKIPPMPPIFRHPTQRGWSDVEIALVKSWRDGAIEHEEMLRLIDDHRTRTLEDYRAWLVSCRPLVNRHLARMDGRALNKANLPGIVDSIYDMWETVDRVLKADPGRLAVQGRIERAAYDPADTSEETLTEIAAKIVRGIALSPDGVGAADGRDLL